MSAIPQVNHAPFIFFYAIYTFALLALIRLSPNLLRLCRLNELVSVLRMCKADEHFRSLP